MKYTNPDREQLQRILAMEAAPDILWGCDEELLDGLKLAAAVRLAAVTILRRRFIIV